MNSLTDVWGSVLQQMSQQLAPTTINTWFDEVDVVTMEDSAFVLHCGNEFKKKTIETRFLSYIRDALRDLFSADFEIKILNDDQLSAYHGIKPDYPGDLEDSGTFTFETYVVGPSNKLAYAAAHAVSDRPGVNYNPLFIYGDSGLGKTHLLYAIAHGLKQNYPDAKVVYIKGDDFTNELVASIREGKTPSSGRNTARRHCCWWTTCSSSPVRSRPRRNSSTPSTPCTRPASRSFSPPTGRPGR